MYCISMLMYVPGYVYHAIKIMIIHTNTVILCILYVYREFFVSIPNKSNF